MSNNENIFQILSDAGINLDADTIREHSALVDALSNTDINLNVDATSDYSALADTTITGDSGAYTSDTSGDSAESDAPSAELTDSDYSDILQNMGFEIEESDSSSDDSDNELENEDNRDEVSLENTETLIVNHGDRIEVYTEPGIQGTTSIRIDNSGEIIASDPLVNIRAVEEVPSGEASEQPAQESNEIPQNSPTLLLKEANSRFSGAEWFQAIQGTEIIIGGMGGIGRLKKILYLCTE